jgi:hypothetical protein
MDYVFLFNDKGEEITVVLLPGIVEASMMIKLNKDRIVRDPMKGISIFVENIHTETTRRHEC